MAKRRWASRRLNLLAAVGLATASVLIGPVVATAATSPTCPKGTDNCTTTSQLEYHGGPVALQPHVFVIYWKPATLQDGSPTFFSPNYIGLTLQFLGDVGGTSLFNNFTQYCSGIPSGAPICPASASHIQNSLVVAGSVGDFNTPYRTDACTDPDPSFGSNCITDGDIQNEIRLAAHTQGWPTDSDNNIYFVFLARGESVQGPSVFGHDTFIAPLTYYPNQNCAYHNNMAWSIVGPGNGIYAVMPYLSFPGVNCPGSNGKSPNGDLDADMEIGVMSHELFEAVTDPENPFSAGWYGLGGSMLDETGDKCNFDFGDGAMPFDNLQANQILHGHYYAIQREWDNLAPPDHSDSGKRCVFMGPSPQAIGDVAPNSGLPGQKVALGAEGFAPFERVDFIYETNLSSQPTQTLGSETVLPDGSVTVNGNIPGADLAGASGAHTIRVVGERSKRSTTVPFTLGVPPGSCAPSSSLIVMVQGSNVTSYIPKGNWSSQASFTGVSVVNVEGNSVTPTRISTPNAVNSCAPNPLTGTTACTANNTDVYLIKGTGLSSTLASSGSGSIFFSGGSCTDCGITMDAVHNRGVITLSLGGTPGFQFLDLATNTFGTPITAGSGQVSEDPLIDPVRNLLLSPSENGTYEIVNIANLMSPAFFENATGGGVLDSAAEDCSTGIALAAAEFSSPSSVFIADLTQATFTSGAPVGTWTAPSQNQVLSESNLSAGASGIAVAQGTHTGVVAGEFGGNALTALALPTTSGSGTPSISDWVTCGIANTPDGASWSEGDDPHTLAAYQSPTGGDAIALLGNQGATWLARVDLTKLLDPTIVSRDAAAHACASGTLPSSVLSFISVP